MFFEESSEWCTHKMKTVLIIVFYISVLIIYGVAHTYYSSLPAKTTGQSVSVRLKKQIESVLIIYGVAISSFEMT